MFTLFSLLILTLSAYHVQGKCQRLLDKGVSAVDQQTIVDEHNNIRRLIAQGDVPGQPRGKNLKTIKWDQALAVAAQKIANTCVFAHVKVNDGRWAVGQNLYWSGTTTGASGSDWRSAIQAWFNEYKTYRYSTTTYNHYTQVIWGNTEYVGCGYTRYLGSRWYQRLYVCNYGPAGNYVGQLPYKLA